MPKNPVADLHSRLATQFPEPPEPEASPLAFWLIDDQHDIPAALAARRQQLGWSQPEAEARCGIVDTETGKGSERLISKIELGRFRDGARKSQRSPIKFSSNETGWKMLGTYRLAFALMDADIADDILSGKRPVQAKPSASDKRQYRKLAKRARADAEALMRQARRWEDMADEVDEAARQRAMAAA